MTYCIVNSENVIENIIVADSEFAESIGALPYYDGARIGETYSPPEPEPDTPDEPVEPVEPAPELEARVAALEEAIAAGLILYEEDLGNG